MQRIGMVGRDFENAAINVRRSRQLLVLLQDDGTRRRFVQAERAVSTRQLLRESPRATARRRCSDYPSFWALMSYLK